MDLPDQLSEPTVLIIGAAVLLGIVWMTFGVRRRGAERDTAQVIAAVQAERDVLRANHAVEIATLEGKLAEAQERARKNMDTALRLKEVERQMEGLGSRAAAAEREAAERGSWAEALATELASLREASGNVGDIVAERDRARQEAKEQAEFIARLRSDLDDARKKLALAEGAEGSEVIDALTAERDQARDEARRLTETVAELRREIGGLAERLEGKGANLDEERRLAAEVNALKEREARLRATVREREDAIAELRQALTAGEKVDHDERVERLGRELEASRAREKTANESLSRLAYEADGLKNRLSSLEAGDSASRAEVEKRDALLELRLQKIYELEAKLRDQHASLMRTQKRAEVAEESLAALAAQATGAGAGAPVQVVATADPETAERAQRLEGKLEEVRAENSSLLAELEALRRAAEAAGAPETTEEAASAGELSAARERIEALQARNATLVAELEAARATTVTPAPAMGAADVEALRKELRTIAERFLEAKGVDDAGAQSAEPSLAERIRAFKATRQTQRQP